MFVVGDPFPSFFFLKSTFLMEDTQVVLRDLFGLMRTVRSVGGGRSHDLHQGASGSTLPKWSCHNHILQEGLGNPEFESLEALPNVQEILFVSVLTFLRRLQSVLRKSLLSRNC